MKLNNKKQCPPDSLRPEMFTRFSCCRQLRKKEKADTHCFEAMKESIQILNIKDFSTRKKPRFGSLKFPSHSQLERKNILKISLV